MSVPADGQPSGLYYLPSHQEAVTSAAWVRPSLEGDKTQQSLNALTERRREEEEEDAGVEMKETQAGGRKQVGKDDVFEAGGKLRNGLANKKTSAELRGSANEQLYLSTG